MVELIVKAYGSFEPCSEACYKAVNDICILWHVDCLKYDAGVLSISYEGIYFPHEEIAQVFGEYCSSETIGKFDYIDLEEWTLTRYFLDKEGKDGKPHYRMSSLNHAIEASQQKTQEYKHHE